mmetsp:Transcript_61778/g.113278  ORF Transcript_61778/g.113278 Transcript_61778/m.113278 type:complete len:236 (+) Transcript_61778:553-1260(+)
MFVLPMVRYKLDRSWRIFARSFFSSILRYAEAACCAASNAFGSRSLSDSPLLFIRVMVTLATAAFVLARTASSLAFRARLAASSETFRASLMSPASRAAVATMERVLASPPLFFVAWYTLMALMAAFVPSSFCPPSNAALATIFKAGPSSFLLPLSAASITACSAVLIAAEVSPLANRISATTRRAPGPWAAEAILYASCMLPPAIAAFAVAYHSLPCKRASISVMIAKSKYASR